MQYRYTLNSVEYGSQVIEDPDGWRDIDLIIRRDPEFDGAFFDFSLPLRYYGTGYDYIKTAFDALGINITINLLIEYSCDDGDSFDTLFEGTLNLSKAKFTIGEPCIVEAPADPIGCIIDFRNNIEKKKLVNNAMHYQSEINAKQYYFSSVLDNQNQPPYQTASQLRSLNQVYSGSDYVASFYNYKPNLLTIRKNDFNVDNENRSEITNTSLFGNYGLIQPDGYVRNALYGGGHVVDYRMKGRVKVSVSGSFTNADGGCADGYNQTEILLSSGTNTTFYFPSDAVSGNQFVTSTHCVRVGDPDYYIEFDYSFSGAITMFDDQQFFLGFHIRQDGNFTGGGNVEFSCQVILDGESYFNISLLTTVGGSTKSFPKMAKHDDLFNQLAEPCLGGVSSLKFFDDTITNRFIFLTNGTQIRMKPQDWYLSFKEFFIMMRGVFALGLWIDTSLSSEKLIVNHYLDFYRPDIFKEYDWIEKIEIITDERIIYNTLTIGYNKSSFEELNATLDCFTERVYANGQNKVRQDLSVKSDIIASDFIIEEGRRKQGQAEEWEHDQDTFIFITKDTPESDGNYKLLADADTAYGNAVDKASFWNALITPARNALRWFSRFMTGAPSPNLMSFVSGTQNFKLTSATQASARPGDSYSYPGANNQLDENEDLEPAEVRTSSGLWTDVPIFTGQIVNFEGALSVSEWITLSSGVDRHFLIGVRKDGSSPYIYGWIREIKYKPEQGKATYTLIMKNPDA